MAEMIIKNTFAEQALTYDIGKKKCIVEPVFKEQSDETIGSILLKLMLGEKS